MELNRFFNRKKIFVLFFAVLVCFILLIVRVIYLAIFRSDYYTELATAQQQRERTIKAARGRIIDRNGVVLAENKSVCTISVIHNQITDAEKVVLVLSEELGIEEEIIRKKVEKVSSIEKIKSNVDKEIGNRILQYELDGVKVDEDYKRIYPYQDLASKVLGFTGGDNQGILGLEAVYNSYLEGTNGTILTMTDAKGIEIDNEKEERIEPINGNDLQVTIDYNIQMYCAQAAEKVYLKKTADSVSVIAMNPQNGEVLAMVDYPEYNLNTPFELQNRYLEMGEETTSQDALNLMWRNQCINDTYEPGSTFKIITTAAALETGELSIEEEFSCPGYIMIEDRKIRCHKTEGHGHETFTEAIQNSCNPVFIGIGQRIGAERFYRYFEQIQLLSKTGIDLPGEASTIMHDLENIGPVELATISFGQSFQISPIQLMTTVASFINGGVRITPHFGMCVKDESGAIVQTFSYEKTENICSEKTSQTICELLESVVSEGGGHNAYIEGYEIGGKTATSQTLPRSDNKYISSFLGFAPAKQPQILLLVVIRNPHGLYYGGTIAAPVAREIFENILPYLDK